MKGPRRIRKCQAAPESLPHTWHLQASLQCGHLDVQSSTSGCWLHLKGYFELFSCESCYVEQGESLFPALLGPLSSVKVPVLNELKRCS